MTTGSLGLRSSASYGSLQQAQNGPVVFPTQTTSTVSRKSAKMVKEKERVYHWVFKFAPQKKIGMLLLCLVSLAVFMWVLLVGKGEDRGESILSNINFMLKPDSEKVSVNGNLSAQGYEADANEKTTVSSPPPPPPPPPPSPPSAYFTGYKLPPGNPCEHFAMPPPPADKKRTGPRPCPVCYLPLEDAISLMPNAASFSPVLKNLTYIHEETLTKTEFGGSEFGGYPSLKQRSDSFDVRESMEVHCGFVKGVKPGRQTGFNIDDADLFQMENCKGIVVASAIFGAFDFIRQPKNISEFTQKIVCFHMFVDEETQMFLRNSSELNDDNKVGLWKVILVSNLPYSDPRRNGKIPKLLLHRLFPNARYSLWIDAKLELVVDPVQLLERFLWRKNATFAISRHYKRFDVFLEAEANKAAGKYDNSSIDFQIEFYKKEGLTPYSADKLPITSDVPEGCVIIREHTPISNLFTCLWFNEVDRFTSRDQISFSTVRDKIRSKTNYTINMFLDCERRNFVVQGYHRDLLENLSPPLLPGDVHPPPAVITAKDKQKRTLPGKRVTGKLRRLRHGRKVVPGGSASNSRLNFV